MGRATCRVLYHLEHDHGIAFHATRHEAAAAAAADGFPRSTGRVGVGVVTQGPGLTNTITALVTARRAGSPVVQLAGDSTEIRNPNDPFAGVQAIDTKALLAAGEIDSIRPTPDTVISDVPRVLADAALRQQPLAVVLPFQYGSSEVSGSSAAPAAARDARAVPDPSKIDRRRHPTRK
jgi:acetolactate synthase I/II/III large subunit